MKWKLAETYSKIINYTVDDIQLNQENIEFFFNKNLLLRDRLTYNQKLGIFHYLLNLIRSGVLQSGLKTIKVANCEITFSILAGTVLICNEAKISTDGGVGYLTLYIKIKT